MPVIITGRKSDIVERRAKELDIFELHQGVSDKVAVLTSVAERYQVIFDEIAYIGDDVNDLPCIECCGYTACPNDAVAEVKEKVKFICKKNGGFGAVREFIEMIKREG